MIDFVERNIHGAWVVYGREGIKQYYGYTKAEAIRRYKADCRIITAVLRHPRGDAKSGMHSVNSLKEVFDDRT